MLFAPLNSSVLEHAVDWMFCPLKIYMLNPNVQGDSIEDRALGSD